jgi:beta-glucanase (GH16 family)
MPAEVPWAAVPFLTCLLPIAMWAMRRSSRHDAAAAEPRESVARRAGLRKRPFRHALALVLTLLTVACVLLVSSCGSAPASSHPRPAGWTQVWRDDFTGPAGAAPSSSWIRDTGSCYSGCSSPHWGTGEIETMTGSNRNARLDGDGHLEITAAYDHGQWTSARLESRQVFQAPADGVLKIEARLKFPAVNSKDGGGYWPAFWLLGGDYRPTHTGWPLVGEIDIAEAVNGRATVFSSLHCGQVIGGPCGEPTGLSTGARPCSDCATSYHDYAVEVDTASTPQQVRWYVDGAQVFSVSAAQIDPTTWRAAISHGFFILLDLAVGGQFPNALGARPSSATAQGKPLMIDYVAVSTQSG